MPASIIAEQIILGRLADAFGRKRIDDARDIEKMTVVEIIRDAVATPSAAAHRQRERQCVVVTAAGREAMRLIDDDAAHGKRMTQRDRPRRFARMQSNRMASPLIIEKARGELGCGIEIRDAIERQHRR